MKERSVFVSASTECFPDFRPKTCSRFCRPGVHGRRVADPRIGPRAEAIGSPRRLGAIRAILPRYAPARHRRAEHRAAPGPDYYDHFTSCCKLAKAIKVVTLVVPCAELGTPFNEEIERLRKLVEIASLEGAVVGLKTQIGRMTQDPDTAVVLCDNVKGLRLTLDPSHYITGPHQGGNIDKVMKYVQHVHLRDSTKDKLHVRVGQGEIDYGKLIQQLAKVGYDRALSVNMTPLEGFDHRAEMRKMRLLLDSLL